MIDIMALAPQSRRSAARLLRPAGLASRRPDEVIQSMTDVAGRSGVRRAILGVLRRRPARYMRPPHFRMPSFSAREPARTPGLSIRKMTGSPKLTVSFAVDDEGGLLGARTDQLEDVGAYPFPGTGAMAPMSSLVFPGPYRLPRYAATGRAAYTNTCGKAAYRGPWMMETVGREQMMDQWGRAAPSAHRPL